MTGITVQFLTSSTARHVQTVFHHQQYIAWFVVAVSLWLCKEYPVPLEEGILIFCLIFVKQWLHMSLGGLRPGDIGGKASGLSLLDQ